MFVVIVALAVARFADGMRGEKVAKSLIFIPTAIALAGAGIIWKFIYAGPPFKVGLANQVAKAIPGLPASLGGDGDKIWLVDRNIGALNPELGAGHEHVPPDRHLHLGGDRVGDGHLLGGHQGRARSCSSRPRRSTGRRSARSSTR